MSDGSEHARIVPMLPCAAGALARHPEASVAERAAAWAYVAEPRTRLDDAVGARHAIEEVRALIRLADVTPDDRHAVDQGAREVGAL